MKKILIYSQGESRDKKEITDSDIVFAQDPNRKTIYYVLKNRDGETSCWINDSEIIDFINGKKTWHNPSFNLPINNCLSEPVESPKEVITHPLQRFEL